MKAFEEWLNTKAIEQFQDNQDPFEMSRAAYKGALNWVLDSFLLDFDVEEAIEQELEE